MDAMDRVLEQQAQRISIPRRFEAAIKENLELKPTWKAKHVEADGRKSWRDIASSAPKEEMK